MQYPHQRIAVGQNIVATIRIKETFIELSAKACAAPIIDWSRLADIGFQ